MMNYARYILTLVFCTPGFRAETTEGDAYIEYPDGIDSSAENILAENIKSLEKWKVANTMMSRDAIMDYITNIRELQKNETLKTFNSLNDDDAQLMKDMRRLNLKVPTTGTQSAGEGDEDTYGERTDDMVEAEGEAEYNARTEDPDDNNENALN